MIPDIKKLKDDIVSELSNSINSRYEYYASIPRDEEFIRIYSEAMEEAVRIVEQKFREHLR